jgi:hypothetical protein
VAPCPDVAGARRRLLAHPARLSLHQLGQRASLAAPRGVY